MNVVDTNVFAYFLDTYEPAKQAKAKVHTGTPFFGPRVTKPASRRYTQGTWPPGRTTTM
jgi:hypothetical protein